MKNFLRAIRYVVPYRRRLILSVLCAFLVAVFWSLNFTAIYPVLTLLNTRQSPQEWVDSCIQEKKALIDNEMKYALSLEERRQEVEKLPPGNWREKLERDLVRSQQKADARLESARTQLHRYQIARKYIYKFAPADCFLALAWVILLVVVGVTLKGFFEFSQETLVGSVVNMGLFDLRNRAYRNVIHLDVEQFNRQGTGEMMARFTNDMEVLGTAKKTLFGKVIVEPLKALACIIIACFISWQLTLLFLVLVPVALYVLSKVARLMKRATHRLLERMSNIYRLLDESFKGIRVVKAFTQEPHERRRFRLATKDYYHKSMLVVKLNAIAGPVVEVLGVMAVAGALLAGAWLVLGGETHLFGLRLTDDKLEAATLLQLYALLVAIADPVRKLSSVYTRLQSGFAASDRIFHYMDLSPSIKANPESRRMARLEKSIEFRDVCFSYQPGQDILTNIHLEIKAGETIALVGRNGSGKSTLANLLPRFYDPGHGTIFIDGVDVREYNLRSLRRQIGVVTQREFLFGDTIYNNITYCNHNATREQVAEAAERAQLNDLLEALPDGLDTPLSEAGQNVNGGHRQRIALARAILRDPSILILDELNSQFDTESDNEIQQALMSFCKDRTTILITHRLKTLEIADRIVVLDSGRIAAVGTHNELMESCVTYQRLHEAYEQRLVA